MLMDIRHPLKDLDQQMIEWAVESDIQVLVLLTKADKLASGAKRRSIWCVRRFLPLTAMRLNPSSLKKSGVDKLRQKLDSWFNEIPPQEDRRRRVIAVVFPDSGA